MCLKQQQLEELKRNLEQLRTQLRDVGFERFTPNRTTAVEKSDDDFQPLNEMHQVIKSAKNQNLTLVLKRTDRALAKYDEDIDLVGLCEECEDCIPFGRLRIFPYARFCVKCQSEQEESSINSTSRKHLTDYRS